MATSQFLESQSATPPLSKVRWYWLLSAVPAAAIAVALTIWLMPGQDLPTKEPVATGPLQSIVQVGPRVAVLPHTMAKFSIAEASTNYTRLQVHSGVIDVWLADASTKHIIEVIVDTTSFIAKGARYRVGFDERGRAFVTVFKGVIDVHPEELSPTMVGSTQSWPDTHPVTMDSYASKLAAYSFREQGTTLYVETSSAVDAGSPKGRPKKRLATTDAQRAPNLEEPDAVTTLWRKARLFQAQGRARDALPLLREIEKRDDPTWSPLALIEEMRLYTDSFASPNKVISLADSFFVKYPNHSLSSEVRHMWCSSHADVSATQPFECKRAPFR